MPLTNPYSSSASIGGVERSLPNDSTTLTPVDSAGIFELSLDLGNLAAGDSFALRIRKKVLSSGTQRLVRQVVFTGAQDEPVFVHPSITLRHGWDITLQKLAGTDRTIAWSIERVS
jgi:hypothetical protein